VFIFLFLRLGLGLLRGDYIPPAVDPARSFSRRSRRIRGQRILISRGSSVADTVPFCLWVAAWHSCHFAEALWQTVSALGDRDTTCALVGGIVALQVGDHGDCAIPGAWRHARERLPFRIR
jgi:ADP-ribosylglycohydrolase